MRVFIYWNLHKACFSIRAEDGPAKGRVVAHATAVTVRDAVFKVSEAGRQRVRLTRRKAVHAGVVGTLEGFQGELTEAGRRSGAAYVTWDASDRRYARYGRHHGRPVKYSPFLAPTFVLPQEGFAPIYRADMVYLGAGPGVFAFDPCDMPCAVEG